MMKTVLTLGIAGNSNANDKDKDGKVINFIRNFYLFWVFGNYLLYNKNKRKGFIRRNYMMVDLLSARQTDLLLFKRPKIFF